MSEEREESLGARLRRAAEAAGLKPGPLSERLKVSDGAVRNWWRDRNPPTLKMLEAYARETGVTVEYLRAGASGVGRPTEPLAEWRVRLIDLILAGDDAPEAANAILERLQPGRRLTEAEAAQLAGYGDEIRATVQGQAGGRWDSLTSEQKDGVLQLIEAVSRGNEQLRQGFREPPGNDAPES